MFNRRHKFCRLCGMTSVKSPVGTDKAPRDAVGLARDALAGLGALHYFFVEMRVCLSSGYSFVTTRLSTFTIMSTPCPSQSSPFPGKVHTYVKRTYGQLQFVLRGVVRSCSNMFLHANVPKGTCSLCTSETCRMPQTNGCKRRDWSDATRHVRTWDIARSSHPMAGHSLVNYVV